MYIHFVYSTSIKPEINSRLPHIHTVTGHPGAPDSGVNYQKKERHTAPLCTHTPKLSNQNKVFT
jgi:hypothetical protein